MNNQTNHPSSNKPDIVKDPYNDIIESHKQTLYMNPFEITSNPTEASASEDATSKNDDLNEAIARSLQSSEDDDLNTAIARSLQDHNVNVGAGTSYDQNSSEEDEILSEALKLSLEDHTSLSNKGKGPCFGETSLYTTVNTPNPNVSTSYSVIGSAGFLLLVVAFIAYTKSYISKKKGKS